MKTSEKDFLVPKTPYKAPGIFEVEADASSASYFLARGALVGPLKINGIGADSVQGDAAFVEYLVKMGATVTRGENWIKTGPSRYGHKLHGLQADVRPIPDAAMTFAAMAPMCEGPTILRGISSWESQRNRPYCGDAQRAHQSRLQSGKHGRHDQNYAAGKTQRSAVFLTPIRIIAWRCACR